MHDFLINPLIIRVDRKKRLLTIYRPYSYDERGSLGCIVHRTFRKVASRYAHHPVPAVLSPAAFVHRLDLLFLLLPFGCFGSSVPTIPPWPSGYGIPKVAVSVARGLLPFRRPAVACRSTDIVLPSIICLSGVQPYAGSNGAHDSATPPRALFPGTLLARKTNPYEAFLAVVRGRVCRLYILGQRRPVRAIGACRIEP